MAVERRVLHTLGVDGGGVLLELQREREAPGAADRIVPGLAARLGRGQQDASDEVEDRRFERRVAAPRPRQRRVDHVAIAGGHAALAHVGPIGGEARHHFEQGFPEAFEREVARAAIALRQIVQRMRQDVQLARHRGEHDELLALVDQVAVRLATAGDPPIEPAHGRGIRPVHEQAVHQVQEPVGRRAVDSPVGEQQLPR